MHLTSIGRRVLIGAVVVLVIGLAVGVIELVVLGCAALAAAVASALLVLEAPSIDVNRTASPVEVDRGQPSSVTLEFLATAQSRRRPFFAIESVAGERRVAAVPAIEARGAHSLAYELDTSRRGNITTGPVVLRRLDPMGLVAAERRISGTANVAVRPRRHHLRMLPTGRRRDLEGPTRERSQGTASFHQLREYVPGDDLRLIHWKSSAKTGTLVVRQMVDTTRPEIVVILDNRHVAIGPSDFEQAVEVAASILQAADQDGFPHQLLLADGRNDVSVDGVPLGYLERLTDVEVSSNDSLLELADAIRARGRSLVYITGDLRPADMSLVARIACDFSPAYMVSIVEQRTAPFIVPPWIRAMPCANSQDFASQWKAVR